MGGIIKRKRPMAIFQKKTWPWGMESKNKKVRIVQGRGAKIWVRIMRRIYMIGPNGPALRINWRIFSKPMSFCK